jgi:hypothetical protein
MEDSAWLLSIRFFKGVSPELQVGFEIAKARVAKEEQPHWDLAATFALLSTRNVTTSMSYPPIQAQKRGVHPSILRHGMRQMNTEPNQIVQSQNMLDGRGLWYLS